MFAFHSPLSQSVLQPRIVFFVRLCALPYKLDDSNLNAGPHFAERQVFLQSKAENKHHMKSLLALL